MTTPFIAWGNTLCHPVLGDLDLQHVVLQLADDPEQKLVTRAMALLIASGQYHRTIRRRRTHLSRSSDVLRHALDSELHWGIDPPPGGVSIWVRAPEHVDCVLLAKEALGRGVVVERGDIYFANPQANRHHLRLGFAAIPMDRIEQGVRILGELVSKQNRD